MMLYKCRSTTGRFSWDYHTFVYALVSIFHAMVLIIVVHILQWCSFSNKLISNYSNYPVNNAHVHLLTLTQSLISISPHLQCLYLLHFWTILLKTLCWTAWAVLMSDPAQSNINKEVYALFMLQCSSSAFAIDTRQVTSIFRILSIGVCIVLISTHHLHCSKMHLNGGQVGTTTYMYSKFTCSHSSITPTYIP